MILEISKINEKQRFFRRVSEIFYLDLKTHKPKKDKLLKIEDHNFH